MIVDRAIEGLKPHVRRLWQEKAVPVIRAKVHKARLRRVERKAAKAIAPPADASAEVVAAFERYRADMSNDEARARYVLALAARAFSDEQLRILDKANLVENVDFARLKRAMSKLAPEEVVGLLEALLTTPAMLDEGTRVELQRVLGVAPVESRARLAPQAPASARRLRPT